jgi:hypothetical protein
VPKVTVVPSGNRRLKATVPVGVPAPGATASTVAAKKIGSPKTEAALLVPIPVIVLAWLSVKVPAT